MRRHLLAMIGATIAAMACPFVYSILAQTPSSALSGQVSSEDEEAMEGVLVSAKKERSTVTVTVVSDQQGHYRFPAARLEPGRYSLRIRAVGYDLEGPNVVEVSSKKTATADLKLHKTKNLASQLSNSEWLLSFPGTQEQKASIRACTHCHTLERIVRSRYTAAEFEQVIMRMETRYTPSSFPLLIQPPNRGGGRRGGGVPTPEQRAQQEQNRRRQAEYLSSINLSAGPQWGYSLRTLSRPKRARARKSS